VLNMVVLQTGYHFSYLIHSRHVLSLECESPAFSLSAWTAALVRAPPLGEFVRSSLLAFCTSELEAACLLPISYVMLGSVVWSHHTS
jgi:hypothetical protein